MIKIGHRGACGYEPENTLRSFNHAMQLGVDMVELDIHICKSGEIVVIHDAFGLHESICAVPDLSVSYYGLQDDFVSCFGALNDVRGEIGLDVASIRNIIKQLIMKNEKR